MTSFDSVPARHSVTGALVKGARGTLHTEAHYAAANWSTPVSIVPAGAGATTELVADAYGSFPQFDDPTDNKTLWFRDLEGGHLQRLYSLGWIKEQVEQLLVDVDDGPWTWYVLEWNNTLGSWPTRPNPLPARYSRVLWVSVGFPGATEPPKETGDVWKWHPGGGPSWVESGGPAGAVPTLDPTGTVDAVPGLQAASDKAKALDGTVRLSIPRGRYLLDSPWFLDATDSDVSTWEIDFNGSEVVLGPNLATASSYEDASTRWCIFLNTVRAALSGTAVTVNDANRATGSGGSVGGLVLRNVSIDPQGANRGLVYFNRANGIELSHVVMGNAAGGGAAVSGFSYTDSLLVVQGQKRGAGGMFARQTDQGDGWVFISPKADSNALFARLTTSHGCKVTGAVTTRFELERCTEFVMDACHLEGQQAGKAMLKLTNSKATIRDSALYPLNDADNVDSALITIVDAADTEIDSHLTIDGGTVVMFLNTGIRNFTPLVNVESADDDTCVEWRGVRCRYASTALGGKWAETTFPSDAVAGPAALNTEVASATGQALLASGSFLLRQGNGSAWLMTSLVDGIRAVSKNSPTAPRIVQALASTGVYAGGTLTNGATYHYATAAVDALGNISNVDTAGGTSGDTAATAGATLTILLRIRQYNAPGRILVWRSPTNAVSAPDRYAILPAPAAEVRVHDTGAEIGDVPWVTTGVPTPGGTDATTAQVILG